MPRKPAAIDEKLLTKGELRKLTALRKSLGEEIADRAFLKWMRNRPAAAGAAVTDRAAEQIAEAVMDLVKRAALNIPRGGYIVRRGRRRVIVERPAD